MSEQRQQAESIARQILRSSDLQWLEPLAREYMALLVQTDQAPKEAPDGPG